MSVLAVSTFMCASVFSVCTCRNKQTHKIAWNIISIRRVWLLSVWKHETKTKQMVLHVIVAAAKLPRPRRKTTYFMWDVSVVCACQKEHKHRQNSTRVHLLPHRQRSQFRSLACCSSPQKRFCFSSFIHLFVVRCWFCRSVQFRDYIIISSTEWWTFFCHSIRWFANASVATRRYVFVHSVRHRRRCWKMTKKYI